LVEAVLRLPAEQLGAVEQFLAGLRAPEPEPVRPPTSPRDWPHAPLHRISEGGTYIVTAGTYEKEHHFRGAERLDYLEANLLSTTKEHGWQLEAWAVFSNHYHFVGHAFAGAADLALLTRELHARTACHVNRLDGAPGRTVWFNYWDTRLTYETSYMARLNYVIQNPVKHGLVRVANQYRWCSAAWYERTVPASRVRTVYRFKTDTVNVEDDFDPI
jgi:putative transposase